MELFSIPTGYFKLDGGAMFGVVPKTIWNKLNPADSNNLCTWSMRCLLYKIGNQLILIDTGIGQKQSKKFFSYYEPHGEDNLYNSILNNGFHPDDITDVILTHLHFDHCGGAVEMSNSGLLKPAFKNARYWSHPKHWEWAIRPNAREKASFLSENILPLQESGQLILTDNPYAVNPNIELVSVNGHTENMFIPHITYKEHKIIYCADLIPSIWHIPLPYVMAYDTRPLLTLDEKKNILEKAVGDNMLLFFEHDPVNSMCSLKMTDKGVIPNELINISML